MLSSLVEERFDIRRRVGSGSFGVVYEAFDRHRGRVVALKILERAAPSSIARFKREFRYLAELHHPNLAELYELLVLGDQWILSMELIRGSELIEHLAFVELQNAFVDRRTPQPIPLPFDADQTVVVRPEKGSRSVSPIYFKHVRDTFHQLAVAIAVLHSSGIVHRDVNPSNIMITSEGRVVLLDFGLVVEASLEDSIDRKAIAGTPGYMSPEQICATQSTEASDWYSFGVLLYQALTGRLPFRGLTALEVMENQMREEPAPAASLVDDPPADLASLADDCIRRDAALRPTDSEVLERLGIDALAARRVERTRRRAPEMLSRGRELRTLRGWVDSARNGGPRLILLNGSPGVGKSILLDKLLDDLRSGPAPLILGGRCHPWESLPLNAIDVIVDSLARELRRAPSNEVAEVLNRAVAVTQLFPVLSPEIRTDRGEETIVVPATGEKLLARAASELASVLAAAAAGRTLVMVLDDAQWGDYQSADMFLRLMNAATTRTPDAMNIVLVFSYRSEDWRTSLLLQAIMNGGLSTKELHLEEPSRTFTAKLLKQTLRKSSKNLVDEVIRQTGNNPCLTGMIVDYLRHEGPGDETALLAHSVAMRLGTLSAPARRLFAFLLSADGPMAEEAVERELELFESDGPIRELRNECLIRLRKTGDLRELDIFHPRMREILLR